MARKRTHNPGITRRCEAAVAIGEREFPAADKVEFHAYKDHPIIAVWNDKRAKLYLVPGAL